VFNNVDMGGDVIRLGAFDKSVQRKKPKGVWMHDGTATVAKTLDTYPVPAGDPRLPEKIAGLGGQYVKGQFNLSTQRGKDAFSDIQFGIVDEFSIGYWPTAQNLMKDGTRELLEIDWLEWSPVLAGMNPLTQLVSAKSGAGDALPLSLDLQTLVDGVRLVTAESERISGRVKARRELRQKAGRELSAANETMLEECAGMMDACGGNIRALLTRVQGVSEDDTAKSRIQGARALLTKQLPMTPEVQSIIEAIDTLLDALLGEPEETEPKSIDPATRTRQIRLIRSRLALVG
jgi:hypothetical protein